MIPDILPGGGESGWGNTARSELEHLASIPTINTATPTMAPLSERLVLEHERTRLVLPPLPTELLLREVGVPYPQRLAHCSSLWEAVLPAVTTPAATRWLLQGIHHGFQLPINESATRFELPNHASAIANKELVSAALDKLIERQIIVPTTEAEAQGVLPLSWQNDRLVLDGTALNDRSPEPEKFVYEDLKHAAGHISSRSWMAKADARLLYYCIPLHKTVASWCCIRWKNQLWSFRGLPLGLSHAPRLATMIMRPLVAVLRRMEINVSQYLDDGLVTARTQVGAQRARATYLQVMTRAGLLMHPDKCSPTPTQELVFLGFLVETNRDEWPVATMVARRRHQLVQQARQLMKATTVPAKKLARWTGSVVATHAAFTPALVLLRRAHDRLAQQVARHGWRTTIELDGQLKEEIKAVRRMFASDLWTSRPLRRPPAPSIILTTDASTFGWGAYLSSPSAVDTPINEPMQGRWTGLERDALPEFASLLTTTTTATGATPPKWMRHAAPILDRGLRTDRQHRQMPDDTHNNILECRAVLYALVAFSRQLRGQSVLIRTDNTTTMAALIKIKSTNIEIATTALMAHWTMLSIDAQLAGATHVAGEANTTADEASRRWIGRHRHLEWPIDKTTYDTMLDELDVPMDRRPTIDAFATAENSKCKHFFSLFPHPLAAGTNGMLQDWAGKDVYLNPPFHMMQQVIDKLEAERPRCAVVVAPEWPNQTWWTRLSRQASASTTVPLAALQAGPNTVRVQRWKIVAFRWEAASAY